MKLTLIQITLLRSALSEHTRLCTERAERCPFGNHKTFWKQEAKEATKLHLLMEDALSVEVESAQCTPPTATKAPRLSSDHVEAEVKRYAREQSLRLAKLIRPGSAMPAPAAIPAPATGMDAASHAADSGPAPTVEPYANATSEATPPAVKDQRPIDRAPSSAGMLNPVLCAASLPPRAPAQAPSEGMHQPKVQAQPEPPAVPDSLHPIDSSAQHGDACGDIHCNGHCLPPESPRPLLISRVDLCTSEEDTRREESLATPAQRRMAARFLQVDLHDLPSALAKRVRTRLQPQAA